MTTQAAANTASAPDISHIVERLRKTFASGRTRSVQWRRAQLVALEKMMLENEEKIADALQTDLCRKPFETYMADTAATASEARYAAKHVKKWMRRRYLRLEAPQLPGRGWVEYEPYGTVLVIGAWNYPIYLT
ncbi:aldehyde dehydrogenase family protein, partial [Mycobacterium sp.]|uniref:aldehyde dehydrogenase family protein n=1 Tax=Mycobacterium sp. TaxID=1785 RepID=UPI0031E16A68